LLGFVPHPSLRAEELKFHATVTSRTVFNLFPDAKDSGILSYNTADTLKTAQKWNSAKVRLG